MLSKCLNPRCSATFQYLGQGRLFRVDFAEAGRKPALTAGEVVAVIRSKTYPAEHFWLCERCAGTMTIESGGAGEVHLICLEPSRRKPKSVASPLEQTNREAAAS